MRLKSLLTLLVALLWIGTTSSCSSSDNNQVQPPIIEPELDYPKGVTVEDIAITFDDGEKAYGVLATIDFSANSNLEISALRHLPLQKPSEVYADFNTNIGTPALVFNAGYFAGTSPVGLVIEDSWLETGGVSTVNRTNDQGQNVTVYPVRSALGMMPNGDFEIQWTYFVDPGARLIYKFPSALDNNEKTGVFMSSAPTTQTQGGSAWAPKEAIAGGPRIVQESQNVAEENYWTEVFHGGGTAGLTRQPRTAVGITSDNKLLIAVIDGRSMGGSVGITLPDLADFLIEKGAVNAMNFDGGGSSAIVGKDGRVLNIPSDTGSSSSIIERSVASTFTIWERAQAE